MTFPVGGMALPRKRRSVRGREPIEHREVPHVQRDERQVEERRRVGDHVLDGLAEVSYSCAVLRRSIGGGDLAQAVRLVGIDAPGEGQGMGDLLGTDHER